MGKIKTRLIKRTSGTLMTIDGLEFNEHFERNKKILGREMPGKKVRNQIAGYIARIKKREKKKQEETEKSIKAISKKE
ncbi:MAG TPA: 30S ribosomal protein S17e [Candidatus Nanoarchaeia archaeon]|nr:30S ribosomal protein S17e [Candidatus Nanoarchaeia archaeon]